MPGFLRIAVVVLVISALAPLSARAARVPGCTGPADSALNQYCETIPAAGGGQTPRPGLPSLAVTLPAGVAKQLTGGINARGTSARSRRALLAVPAPTRPSVNGGRAAISTVGTSTFPTWLIIVLIAIALTLGAVAAARWRQRHRPSPPDGTAA